MPWDFRPRAIVFDNDGVLLNTERYCAESKRIVLERHGVAVDDALMARLKGRHYSLAGEILAEALGRPGEDAACSAEARAEQIRLYHSAGIAPLTGSLGLVAACAARLPVAVASSSPLPAVRHVLEQHGFLDHIRPAHVVCCDSPGGPHPPKPDPDLYLEACRTLDVDPEHAAAVEDSASGLLAARAAGMYVIGVGPAPTPELTALADEWVLDLADPGLRGWIEKATP
ncbi:HAD family hydrolase (plasmid) [Streptomyces sp. BI20]|uniref:HAD family hydrolase n=1 Tax=Streptomyces sp. BI20 TaxID=3403460 RepID=UPI003C72C6B8